MGSVTCTLKNAPSYGAGGVAGGRCSGENRSQRLGAQGEAGALTLGRAAHLHVEVVHARVVGDVHLVLAHHAARRSGDRSAAGSAAIRGAGDAEKRRTRTAS